MLRTKLLIFFGALLVGLILPFFFKGHKPERRVTSYSRDIDISRQKVVSAISALSSAMQSNQGSNELVWVRSARAVLQQALESIDQLKDELKKLEDEKKSLEIAKGDLDRSLKAKEDEYTGILKDLNQDLSNTKKEVEELKEIKFQSLKEEIQNQTKQALQQSQESEQPKTMGLEPDGQVRMADSSAEKAS